MLHGAHGCSYSLFTSSLFALLRSTQIWLLSFFNIEVDADRGTITIKTEERATFNYEADQGAALLGVSAQAEEESDKCNQS